MREKAQEQCHVSHILYQSVWAVISVMCLKSANIDTYL